jgi:hypothetical protein
MCMIDRLLSNEYLAAGLFGQDETTDVLEIGFMAMSSRLGN